MKERSGLPFTPFHLGPSLLLGLVLATVLDLPVLVVASMVPDVEPFLVLFSRVPDYPLHGFFHSYLGSSILAVLVVAVFFPFRSPVSRVVAAFGIPQRPSFRKMVLAAFIGVYSHVFLDSFLYPEMAPLFPLQGNPFLYTLSAYDAYMVVYGFCAVTFVVGIAVCFYRILRKAKP